MHVLVAWEIEAENLRWSQINDLLLEALKRFESTTVLLTVQVVRVNVARDRETIMRQLLQQIEQIDEAVELLVSPVMQGQYEGYLPDETWPQLNRITS